MPSLLASLYLHKLLWKGRLFPSRKRHILIKTKQKKKGVSFLNEGRPRLMRLEVFTGVSS